MTVDLRDRLQAALGAGYRVEKELGGGGMSRVFLAEELRLGRRVVVKVLPPEMAAGVSVDRFEREIQLAARLQHPHVVPLLTAGSSEDLLFYVMPFIEGESMRARLAREGELPVAEALRILHDVLDALAYAHAQHVVHRDIKPDNVLLSGKHALVTDFGVAKAVAESTGKTALTSMGVALGTPAYMAPEQATADPHTDHRADIYAVGALAYEMLSGRPPFTGMNAQAVLAAHLTEAPEPVTRHRAAVPEALSSLIGRCLEKKPADRPQRAEEVLALVEAMATPTGGITPTATAPHRADGGGQNRTDGGGQDGQGDGQASPARVAGLFAASSLIVLLIVYFLVQLIGLPDWVFYGAIALLAIGLPIMLLTSHHERRRAVARSAGRMTATPSGGLTPYFTWRKALMGGGVAFAGLGVISAGYMAMRGLGIGPAGTLLAAGRLPDRARLIVADFENRSADSALAVPLTEALRIDLSQSPVVRVLSANELSAVLQRMNRPADQPMTGVLAREIAQREGIPAVVLSEIGTVGREYVLSVRVIATADGAELVALREAAAGDAILSALDRLSTGLRERIGESFRSLRATPPLERVTTSSLEALQLYSRAVKAEGAGDYERAIQLHEQAVGLDSTFGMAYRKLAVVLSLAFADRSRVLDAATRAFRHRSRLPAVERYLAEAYYHDVVERDQPRVIAAYRSALDLDPDNGAALNNLANELNNSPAQRAEAEALYRRALVATDSATWQYFANLSSTQYSQGKVADAETTIAAFGRKHPDNPNAARYRAYLAYSNGDYDGYVREAEAMAVVGRGNVVWERWRTAATMDAHGVRGRLTDAGRMLERQERQERERGAVTEALGLAIGRAAWETVYRDRPARAVALLDEALQRYPLERLPAEDRPYAGLVIAYAQAGAAARARALKREWRQATPQSYQGDPFEALAEGHVAVADGNPRQALAEYERFREALGCAACVEYDMGRAYDALGERDSALIAFERGLDGPDLFRWIWDPRWRPGILKRAGELHEARGNRERAVARYTEFTELWKNADPDLQAVVSDVRQRIARLTAER